MARKKTLYVPSPTVNSYADIERELRRIQDSFDQVAAHIATEKSTEEPDKVVDLQVRYADGVTWNPRNLGAGLYINVDGVWRKISLT